MPRSRAILRYVVDGALILFLAGIGLYGAARLALQPRELSAGVAVLFTPWTGANDTLTRSVAAGARFVRYGGYPFVAVVMPDDAGYPSRMLAAGAILVADPRALAACLPSWVKRDPLA